MSYAASRCESAHGLRCRRASWSVKINLVTLGMDCDVDDSKRNEYGISCSCVTLTLVNGPRKWGHDRPDMMGVSEEVVFGLH